MIREETTIEHYIYDRYTGDLIPVSAEQEREIYLLNSKYRLERRKEGKCLCPGKKYRYCNTDCDTCKYQKSGGHPGDCNESLDILENVGTTDTDPAAILERQERSAAIKHWLENRLPQEKVILAHLKTKSVRGAAVELKMKKSTLEDQVMKSWKSFCKYMKNY